MQQQRPAEPDTPEVPDELASQAGVERLETVWMSLRRRNVARFSGRTLLAALLTGVRLP